MINRQLWVGVTLLCVMAFTGCANNTGGNAEEAAQAEPKKTPAPKWQPRQAALMTRWAKDVSPENAHPEYPRPQMVRKDWLNLNGLWDYAITPATNTSAPQQFEGKILVPFPIESALSGVKKRVDDKQRLWYRRTFKTPEAWANDRGRPRTPDCTPHELVALALAAESPMYENAGRLVRLYGEMAYASRSVSRESAGELQDLWQMMRSTRSYDLAIADR